MFARSALTIALALLSFGCVGDPADDGLLFSPEGPHVSESEADGLAAGDEGAGAALLSTCYDTIDFSPVDACELHLGEATFDDWMYIADGEIRNISSSYYLFLECGLSLIALHDWPYANDLRYVEAMGYAGNSSYAFEAMLFSRASSAESATVIGGTETFTYHAIEEVSGVYWDVIDENFDGRSVFLGIEIPPTQNGRVSYISHLRLIYYYGC